MTDYRRLARELFQAGLDAVEPQRAVAGAISCVGSEIVVQDVHGTQTRFPRPAGRIVAVGMGKAAAAMARGLEESLGDCLEGGLVITKAGHSLPLAHIEVAEAGHPVPDQRGVAAATRMAEILAGLGPDDLAVVLLSGGGSALAPLPLSGVRLADKQTLTRELLAAGAPIDEVNAVRTPLSRLKGGGLVALAAPARVVALILSDVIGDRLDVIASGATVAPRTSAAAARSILARRGLWERAPASVRQALEQPLPPPAPALFARVTNALVGSNASCLAAIEEAARSQGWARVAVVTDRLAGEAREVGTELALRLRERAGTERSTCLIYGGETTVTLRGPGRGGRNQELVLAAALALDGVDRCALFSAGTDGTDGPTDAAGAIALGDTLCRARSLGLDGRDHLARNDSYAFFHALGDLILTGPTRTNVMDVQLALSGVPMVSDNQT